MQGVWRVGVSASTIGEGEQVQAVQSGQGHVPADILVMMTNVVKEQPASDRLASPVKCCDQDQDTPPPTASASSDSEGAHCPSSKGCCCIE